MTEAQALERLEEVIRAQIQASGGALPFSEFMRMALYEPGLGYYERTASQVGRSGDFITSVSVGPLFGELLASRFATWADSREKPEAPLQIVEIGAHDGRLAHDILGWLRQNRPSLFERTQYTLLEPSSDRARWQRDRLGGYGSKAGWARNWGELAGGVRGVILANELLDALPITRVQWDPARNQWIELGVTSGATGFSWTRLDAIEHTQIEEWLGLAIPRELQAVLPADFTLDLIPGAVTWWREAARALRSGWIVTFDYGLEADELLTPRHAGGTLRAYRQQRHADSILASPGAQDLTAHVNFTPLAAAGIQAGLSTRFAGTQRQFLTEIATRGSGSGAGVEWSASRLRQFQALTHPEHFGRSFRVLVQERAGRG